MPNAGGSISICKSGRSRERSLFFFANGQKAVSFVSNISVEKVSNRTRQSSKTLGVIIKTFILKTIILFITILLSEKLYSQDKYYSFQGQNYFYEKNLKKDKTPFPISHKDGNYAFYFDNNQRFYLTTYRDNILLDTVYYIANDTLIQKNRFDFLTYTFTYAAYFEKGKKHLELFYDRVNNMIHSKSYSKNQVLLEEDYFVAADETHPVYNYQTYTEKMIKRIVYLYKGDDLKYKICVYGLNLLGNADLYVKYSPKDKFIGIIDSKEFYYLQNQKYKKK